MPKRLPKETKVEKGKLLASQQLIPEARAPQTQWMWPRPILLFLHQLSRPGLILDFHLSSSLNSAALPRCGFYCLVILEPSSRPQQLLV